MAPTAPPPPPPGGPPPPEGPPPWQWPEAAAYVLQQQLGLGPSALPCSSSSACSIPRALRFMQRLMGVLLRESESRDRSRLAAATSGAPWSSEGPLGAPGGGPAQGPPFLSPHVKGVLEECLSCLRDAESSLWLEVEELEAEETLNNHKFLALLTEITTKYTPNPKP